MSELQVKFYLGQYEEFSPGDSTSDSPEKLLQRGSGEGQYIWFWWRESLVQFSSVTQSCLTLCDPTDCSTPGFPVHHQLPELAQIHVHPVGDVIQPAFIPFSFCIQFFPASGSFPMSQFFASSGQSVGASASASVLPMNIQDWVPSGLTG